ncbi:hypothetical protein CEUSTIGMA_g476.t1 [Chlamydomonas eustigma]|uniref:Inward rectifier potassium channel C-terminal domain-containing protein n=1 Tax=Chlamydomonas eustigma TaxID=1157962 RepID=A0A250WQ97_9CHLO|nr:hypothetical protein CEUSTIGMA_g476.t1 [Chlamydomonas eustigma]|eukprot:GAX73024.1 hypothetical protein CEUSTIGMA_g476.t1 [Chlamydomonas eustigma]
MSFTRKESTQQMDDEEAGVCPLSPTSIESLDKEERAWLLRRQEQRDWRVDHGAGYYQEDRQKKKISYLVETGRRAGRSTVKFEGIPWGVVLSHILKRDFFNAAVNAKLWIILIALCIFYTITITAWAHVYYIHWRIRPECFVGFTGPVSAFMFSVETQQTIGYGVRAPVGCLSSALLVAIHSLLAVVMDSIILGIAFARISHPKNRGRTVLVSNCAVISRRDGILKLMFRIGDIQRSTVVSPRIHTYLYSWGDGHRTAEGEFLPVQVKELDVYGWDRSLILPTIVEHTIDESSPLFGLTHQRLEALNAEIVVVFEGSTELGDMFMVRQSYMPPQIHWGHSFCQIIKKAPEGQTRHKVDLSRFHDVEPQDGLDSLPPYKLSAKVIATGGARTLPPPAKDSNTLVLSDDGVIGLRDGRPYLMFRLGDTFPEGQVEDVRVSATLFRWSQHITAEGEVLPFAAFELPLNPPAPMLRFPATLVHKITECSPIASWATPEGKRLDVDSEIVVNVKGVISSTHRLITRTRVYPVLGNIKWGSTFYPIVSRSTLPDSANVDWSCFHLHVPTSGLMELRRSKPRLEVRGMQSMMSYDPVSPVEEENHEVTLMDRAGSAQNLTYQASEDSTGRQVTFGKPHMIIMGGTGSKVTMNNKLSSSSGGVSMRQSLAATIGHNSSRHSSSTGASHENTSGRYHQQEILPVTVGAASSSHFGAVAGESWKEKRSLFDAISSLHSLAASEQAGDNDGEAANE